MKHQLALTVLPMRLAVCRFAAASPIPAWATEGEFFSITRTQDELSIVCPQHMVPPGFQCERDWACLKVEGVLDFSMTGVLVALAAPLAAAGVSLFAISTYDTDYLLVKAVLLERAVAALSAHGQAVHL